MMTPLLITCQHGHREIAEMLVLAGANQAGSEPFGWTPFEITIAAHHSQKAVLVRNGGRTDIGDNYIGIAKMLARAWGPVWSKEMITDLMEDDMRKALAPLVMRSQWTFCCGLDSETFGASSPVQLLCGFPEIVEFIIVQSSPPWMIRERRQFPELP